MKKTLILIGTTFILKAVAQPVLTNYNINPQIGDVHIVYNDNIGFITTDGPNQFWDLSYLNSGIPSTYTIFTPSLSTSYTMFPASNIASVNGSTVSVNSNTAQVFFYNASDSALSYLGSYQPNYTFMGSGSIGYYSTYPKDEFRYPLTYNTLYTDTTNLFNFGTYSGNLILSNYSHTTYTVSFVGYGTMALPNGIYSSVAKVRTQESTVKYYINPIDSSYEEKMVEKFYLDGNRFMPIASTQTVVSRFPTHNTIIYTIPSSYYTTSIMTNISYDNLEENRLDIFPNPAIKSLHIKSLYRMKIKSVQIKNSQGKIILSEKNDSSLMSQSFNVENFPEGLYFVSVLFEDDTVANDKLIIK